MEMPEGWNKLQQTRVDLYKRHFTADCDIVYNAEILMKEMAEALETCIEIDEECFEICPKCREQFTQSSDISLILKEVLQKFKEWK